MKAIQRIRCTVCYGRGLIRRTGDLKLCTEKPQLTGLENVHMEGDCRGKAKCENCGGRGSVIFVTRPRCFNSL